MGMVGGTGCERVILNKIVVMVSDYKEILSDSAKGMKRSAIRELLKLTQKPEIISFAGGLPDKKSFPLEQLQEICAEVIATDGAAACQYGSTEGVPELREIIAERYRKQGLGFVTAENITIVTASQQSLDFIGKVFLNRGDKYVCELPSYLGALGAFNSYGGVPVGIPQDEKGVYLRDPGFPEPVGGDDAGGAEEGDPGHRAEV